MRWGAFLVRDNRVFNGPLGRSLRSFVRTAHSAHLLRNAHSLMGQLKLISMCSHCDRAQWEETGFLIHALTYGGGSVIITTQICMMKYMFLLTARNAIVPVDRVFSVNTNSQISTVL